MSNILLVEPDYRSKFPPLGLLRISAFHKAQGDSVTFVRGNVQKYRERLWHRIYVSSLFTYELPRTVATIKFYAGSVESPSDIYVGGIGATLLGSYIRERVACKLVEGPLDRPGLLGLGENPVATLAPDYSLIDSSAYKYRPEDSYYCRITTGCIRNCGFCAVPKLEPVFGYCGSIAEQIETVCKQYGERQNLVLLDNNVLAMDGLDSVVDEIRDAGFQVGAKRNNRQRTVDFNQGIDARLITPHIAEILSTICLSPVRLAFDFDAVESDYRRAIAGLAACGFQEFTNYVMFNYNDTPEGFYRRLRVNLEMSELLNVRVTGFPMRYIPIDHVSRGYVSKGWRWRYLRGIQCILLATHGLVSPNHVFFDAAFGATVEEFLEIVSMPDRYIIQRHRFADEGRADEWRSLYRSLAADERDEFLGVLERLHKSKTRKLDAALWGRFRDLLSHYYPDDGELAAAQPMLV